MFRLDNFRKKIVSAGCRYRLDLFVDDMPARVIKFSTTWQKLNWQKFERVSADVPVANLRGAITGLFQHLSDEGHVRRNALARSRSHNSISISVLFML
jgi:hypothetical protein